MVHGKIGTAVKREDML